MVAIINQPEPLLHAPTPRRKRYVGEVVYMCAYDVAYEMSREPVSSLLGQKLVTHEFDVSRKNPRRHMFYKPQMVSLPAVERTGPHGSVRVECCVKLLPVGAISITVRVPFAVDERAEFDETLYVMELANLQLAELEAYDRLLDASLERSYRDLGQRRWRGRVHVLQELREIRIDLARFSDELMNITKFIGDWHLARVYETISARFHLADWHRTIDEKLKTLDGLYEILKHDQNNRWMLSLEVTIVLLFIIDLIILFSGAK